ncbi:hypothetical protein R3P38DRAFT_3187480 [Favolaschia claudopus]|uniref:Uncharacterized protein n=1 Tax=Favolaschia claudopus TaxID=2862362 RepID=A0AAW0BZT5_9AGAR
MAPRRLDINYMSYSVVTFLPTHSAPLTVIPLEGIDMSSYPPRLRDRLSSLKRLSLEWASLTSHITIQSIDYFSSASSLVDFTFDNQSCVPVTLPANLTRYDVYAPWHMHSKVLKLCPSIVDARITVEPWTEFSLDIVVLKNLERLYASTPEILNYIHAPKLEGLAFHIRDKDRDAVVLSSVDTLIQRSACTLKSICLKGLPSDILTTTQILRNLSAITKLAIIADTYDAAVNLNELVAHLAAKT